MQKNRLRTALKITLAIYWLPTLAGSTSSSKPVVLPSLHMTLLNAASNGTSWTDFNNLVADNRAMKVIRQLPSFDPFFRSPRFRNNQELNDAWTYVRLGALMALEERMRLSRVSPQEEDKETVLNVLRRPYRLMATSMLQSNPNAQDRERHILTKAIKIVGYLGIQEAKENLETLNEWDGANPNGSYLQPHIHQALAKLQENKTPKLTKPAGSADQHTRNVSRELSNSSQEPLSSWFEIWAEELGIDKKLFDDEQVRMLIQEKDPHGAIKRLQDLAADAMAAGDFSSWNELMKPDNQFELITLIDNPQHTRERVPLPLPLLLKNLNKKNAR